jgi:hypothetical protein
MEIVAGRWSVRKVVVSYQEDLRPEEILRVSSDLVASGALKELLFEIMTFRAAQMIV